jgi:NTE family protein
VGLILGGGGLKAYAHVGVLRQLQAAKIPVHSVVGLEWGSLIGALYAVKGLPNDGEWQGMKIKSDDLPGASLLGGRRRGDVASLDAFMASTFGDQEIERMRIDFACPTQQISGDRVVWQSRGNLRASLLRCLPYPPIFGDHQGFTAAPLALLEAAQWLRAKGAQVIVLVNPLGSADHLTDREARDLWTDSLLWSEVRRQVQRANQFGVQHVLNIPTSGASILNADSRRSWIEAGSRSGSDFAKSLARQYGF